MNEIPKAATPWKLTFLIFFVHVHYNSCLITVIWDYCSLPGVGSWIIVLSKEPENASSENVCPVSRGRVQSKTCACCYFKYLFEWLLICIHLRSPVDWEWRVNKTEVASNGTLWYLLCTSAWIVPCLFPFRGSGFIRRITCSTLLFSQLFHELLPLHKTPIPGPHWKHKILVHLQICSCSCTWFHKS